MNFVISKEPEVQAIQRLLRAILRGFALAGDKGVEMDVVRSPFLARGLSDDKTSMLIDSLIEQQMITNTEAQSYAISVRGRKFLDSLEEAYASSELPAAPPLVIH